MLKWLRQKPSGHEGHGSGHHNSSHHNQKGQKGDGQEMSNQKKIVTDDPLATIPVHPQVLKKSKNKSSEIYAVSRVNPLFEEEDVPKAVVQGGGNRSGSSGYDSGPTSDDDDIKFLSKRTTDPSNSSASSVSSLGEGAGPRAPSKLGQLFRDKDDPVVHHQAAILAPNGRPVLHIVEQNPDFVQSIAVALGHARPIDPSNSPKTKVKSPEALTKVSVHPVPSREAGDSVGVAKLINKDARYVHSIVIGKSAGQLNKAPSTTPSSSHGGVTRKPSVTFAERVELVSSGSGNHGHGPGRGIIYRKPSAEQDSIVTESLLLMTSRPLPYLNNTESSNANHSRKAEPHLQRKQSTTSEDDSRGPQEKSDDLQAFSSSIRKNHPIKHILSISGRSLEISPAADTYSSTEFKARDQKLNSNSSSSSPSASSIYSHDHSHKLYEIEDCIDDEEDDGNNKQPHNRSCDDDRVDHDESDETRSRSDGSGRCRRASVCPKSPFGGIADHYAAAKEIAKEIESYSKSTTNKQPGAKKNIVRDLLSGRGRDAFAPQPGGVGSAYTQHKNKTKNLHHSDPILSSSSSSTSSPPMSPRHAAYKEALEGWEEVRVQQVYLKGRSWKPIQPTQKGHEEAATSHRVISVSHHHPSNSRQGQVQPKDLTQFKGSIYNGLSSEGASSNNDGDEDTSSDSGNSTDRNSKSAVLPERRVGTSRSKSSTSAKPPDPNAIEESPVDKVMIVTGDKNMVVDLSGVPLDLREAIITGSALITLPEELNQAGGKKQGGKNTKQGYTIVTIPSSMESSKGSSSTSVSTCQGQVPGDLELRMSSEEIYNRIFNNYGTKNKRHIWEVMQQSVQQTLIEDEKGKKKRITTILPFHPNQDVYKSPDFTMEGQRQERQTKRLDLAKKRRCVCRVFGILFFLATFIGVLVALSMIYTKGQRYFGSA